MGDRKKYNIPDVNWLMMFLDLILYWQTKLVELYGATFDLMKRKQRQDYDVSWPLTFDLWPLTCCEKNPAQYMYAGSNLIMTGLLSVDTPHEITS